jgi:thioredoxin 1
VKDKQKGKNKMVTVKKFSAVWCGPCRALAPVINEIKNQFSNVKFEDYDVDVAYDEATKYGIRSVPTVIIEKDGKEINRFTGMSSKMAYINAINECIQ